MAKDLPVYVINRACDQDRLAAFSTSAPGAFTRIPAIDAHDPDAPLFLYRDLVGKTFWGERDIKPGAFGCYLSHMNAWARMLGEQHEAALICEDDITLTGDLKRLTAQARRHGDYDIIFANDRMTKWRASGDQKSDNRLIPAQTVIERLQTSEVAPGENDIARAPGADAYVISARGAAAMLQRSRRMGIVAGVDWVMLAQGLAAHPEGKWPELAFLADLLSEDPLTVLVTDNAIGKQGDWPSTISHKTTRPLEGFCESTPVVRHEKGAKPQPQGAPLAFPKGPTEDPVFVTLAEGRLHEEPALALMARWMPDGGTFVDIGAHVGTHSLFMVRHGGAGRAVPIECNKRVIPLLRRAVEANSLEDRFDLTRLGIAVGEERGKKEMVGAKREYSAARLREGFVEDIRVRPTGAMLRDTDPHMIKVDVNGEERDVLKGMRKILRKRRPLLAIDLSRPKSQKVFPFLERLGYHEAERVLWSEGEGDEKLHKVFAIFSAGPIRETTDAEADAKPDGAKKTHA